jgi:signal transduction histidine kinase
MSGTERLDARSAWWVRNSVFAVILIGWAALGALVFAVYDYTEEWQIRAVALSEARAASRKDMSYRLWAAKQGGVYVPVEITPPNPYLDVPNRDVTTTTGRRLTLVNPAYMTRLVHELAFETYGLRAHITSRNPVRRGNQADAWEARALARLAAGAPEFYEDVELAGQPFLRYMAPLMTRKECLKCHAQQGYREGDLRGGLSVSIPYQSADMNALRVDRREIGLALALIWLVGLAGLAAARLMAGKAIASRAAAQELKASGERERAKMQERLLQTQKMESMGLFAGGVAHDFNNMLQAILGNAAVALDHLPADSPARENLAAIQTAGRHSAALTRQLLAFAREQPLAPKRLDLNEQVAGMLRMLERMVGEHVRIEWRPGEQVKPVFTDPALVGRVVANLVLNARDACAGGGTITVSTANVRLDAGEAGTPPGLAAGEYVLLTVADDGPGIEPEALPRLFEPFFTTKPVGEGTGLGLAAVYGAVAQCGGAIIAESTPGAGATFKVYCPAV